MKRRLLLCLLVIVVIAACQPTPEDNTLPTVAVLPTETATNEPMETPTQTATATETHTPTETRTPTHTATATLTETPAPTETATHTPTLTRTPTRTPTFTSTPNVVAAAQASSTARVLEAPTLATFTPAPAGVQARPTSTGTPQVVADVVITEFQMQEDVDRLLVGKANVQSALINFTPEGIRVSTTLRTGDVFASGSFLVRFEMSQVGFENFVIISADSPDAFVMANNLPPSDDFVGIAYQDVVPAVFGAFNDILNRRLGEGRHNLDNLFFTEDVMAVSLLVPVR